MVFVDAETLHFSALTLEHAAFETGLKFYCAVLMVPYVDVV